MPKKRTPKKMPSDLSPLIGPNSMRPSDSIRSKLGYMNKEVQRIKLEHRYSEILERIYLSTKNALATWDCYREARERKEPIPDWVLKYFDRAGKNLCRKGTKPGEVAYCLGLSTFSHGRSCWKQYEDYWTRRRAVMSVLQELYENPKQSIESACEKVIEKDKTLKSKRSKETRKLDIYTLKKWYEEMNFEW